MTLSTNPKSGTSSKRFKIGEKVYEFADASDISLRDLLMVEKETVELGHPIHMGEIARLSELFQSMTKEESQYHPEAGWMLAITIWMAMVKDLRDTGDHKTLVTFGQAIDFKFADFTPLTDPADHLPKGPGKPDPRKPSRPASGRDAKRPPQA